MMRRKGDVKETGGRANRDRWGAVKETTGIKVIRSLLYK